MFSSYSRNRIQQWIKSGYLLVDGEQRRSKERLLGGETLELAIPPDVAVDWLDFRDENPIEGFAAEPIEFPIVFEDDSLLVINKPAGLVMHPAPGNRKGTLLNGLLYHCPHLVAVPRAGIVHRLDKDTTGLCVVAKTLAAHTHLVRQLQAREMGRKYTAIVVGDVPLNGTIEAPIGRHSKDRKKMAVNERGKNAVTHYVCSERYTNCGKVTVSLETGRTHQIRVHMNHIGHALIGDPVYGRRLAVLPRILSENPVVAAFSRQALHAHELRLVHPFTMQERCFNAPLPPDMLQLCDSLRESSSS